MPSVRPQQSFLKIFFQRFWRQISSGLVKQMGLPPRTQPHLVTFPTSVVESILQIFTVLRMAESDSCWRRQRIGHHEGRSSTYEQTCR